MKTYKNLYPEIYSKKNLILSWKKARKGKTKKEYVVNFEKEIVKNINSLYKELKNQTYKPKPMEVFVLRDPKTRKISRSDFRDRVVHHALCNIIEPIFDKTFIYDNCANRKGKGSLFALERFEKFRRKVTKNFSSSGYCFKADIKHYFKEINHGVLLKLIKNKIKCERTISLIKLILKNGFCEKGMPLGNLTSQFFANLYLNAFDYFVKLELRAKNYIRYVDDFVIIHPSEIQLKIWKEKIKTFLNKKLILELHPDKSNIMNLSKGIDFVGFRNFYYYRLLRKRSYFSIKNKIKDFNKAKISENEFKEIWQGWNAYANWANTYNLRKSLKNKLK
jgi:RNA-directed DNA polymerase